MRTTIGIILIAALVCTLCTTNADEIGEEWPLFEPEWKYVCFDAVTGEIAQNLTPKGFCQRSNKQCVGATGASCIAGGGVCRAMNGWCVCANAPHPAPAGFRCHAVARGELDSPITGASDDGDRISTKPESAFVYACFDQDSNEVVPHLKPDGFCGAQKDKNGHFRPISYDCEDGASCVQVPGSNNKIWSCQRDDVKSVPAGHICHHMNAVELAAAVRGWPHPSDINEFL